MATSPLLTPIRWLLVHY